MQPEPGVTVRCIPYDLADLDGIPALVKGIHDEFGSLDVLLNIAGYAEPKSLLDTTADNLVTTFTINVFAMLLLTREFVRYMQGRPAKILNIASTAGITSRPGWVAYAASKAAVVSLSGTLADELAGTGIKVYSISPGPDRDGAAADPGARRGPDQDHAAERRGRGDRHAHARRRTDAGRPEHHRPPAGLSPAWAASNTCSRARCCGSSAPSSGSSRSGRTRIVLATARVPILEGNLAAHPRRHRRAAPRPPGRRCCWSPTATACAASSRYLLRLVRGHVPPADGRAVRRGQRVPARPCRAASRGHDRRPGVARGRRRSSASGWTR